MNLKNIYKEKYNYTDLKDMINGVKKLYSTNVAFAYNRDGKKVEVSFNAFKNDIDYLGTYLYSKGFCGDKKIAVLGENSYEWIVSYFTAVNGGNVIIPIDKELKANEIASLLNRSNTDLLIFSNQKKSTVEEIKEIGVSCEKFICMNEFEEYYKQGKELIASGNKDYINCEIDPYKMSTIIFTSGTTGNPKGVMLSHHNFVSDAYNSISCMCIPRNTVAILPFNHTFGFMASIMCQLWMGYSVFINSSIRQFMNDIKEAKPGHISVVPLFIENIYKNIWKNAEKAGKAKELKALIKTSNSLRKVGIDLRKKFFKTIIDNFGGNLEMIISGGAPIDEEYMMGFDDLGITIINGFGITECSPIVALNRVDNIKYGTVGNPVNNTKVKIVNPDENGEGEIWVKGDIVMMGYYDDIEATERVMKDGWFNTEDIGKIVDKTFLSITGRKKNLIILPNGKNVYPEELETLIARIENVTEVLVYEEDEQITCEIFSDVKDDEKDEVREKIKKDIQELNQKLANYQQIRKIKFRTVEFEKTTTKKIKRNYTK